MTRYKHRRIFIVAASRRDAANASLESQGFGPDNFSVPLVPGNGRDNAPATQYLCDVACDDALLAALRSIAQVKEKNPGPLGTPGRVGKSLQGENLKRKPRRKAAARIR